MKQLLLILMMAVINQLTAQNVGIGTETPAEKLEVDGNIRISRGADRTISVTPAPGGVWGNSLIIRASSTQDDNNAAGGGNLELWGGRSNAVGIQAGGNIILTTGLNYWSDQSGKHGDIVFRGGDQSYPQNIVEFARMNGTSGNWGFGTATPTARLDVVGTVKTAGLQLTTGPGANKVMVSDANGVASWGDATNVETDPEVGANTTNYLSKWNGTQLVTSGLFETGGKVGIGSSAPDAKLHIQPGADVQNAPASDLVLARIWTSNSDTRASAIFHYYSSTTTNDNLAFGVSGGGGTNAAPNALAQIKMVIQGNGNVGIGTITPVNKLHVAGTGGLRVNSTNPGTGTSDWIAGNFGGTAGNRVVMGNQSGVATIGAHNNALNAWANLSINPGGGNVGIGTLAPVSRLDIEGGITIGSTYAGANAAPADGAIIEGRLGIGLNNPNTQLDVYGNFRLGKSGSELNNVIKSTAGFAARVFAANASAGSTYAVAGVATGGSVMVSPSSPLPSGLVIAFAFVSSNGNVDVVFCNTLGGPINYAGGINLFITVVN